MKKIYTLIALSLSICSIANAQRIVDLQVTMIAPAGPTTLQSGASLATNLVVKNVGTTTFKTTDTILYGYTIDGSLIQFTSGSQTFTTFYRTGKQLLPNDTVQLNKSFTITFQNTLNGKHNYCGLIGVTNRSADSLKETITTNNSSCDSITFAGGTNDVKNLTATTNVNSVLNTYPNPVIRDLNLDINLIENSDVLIKITDLTGRVVYSESKGMLNRGKHTLSVNTSDITPGFYIYRVTMGSETSASKIYIAR